MTGSGRGEPGGFAPGAPLPDLDASAEGFVVEVAPGERIHFLDWAGPDVNSAGQGETAGPPTDEPRVSVLLIHGLGGTAWVWTAVARRLRRAVRTVAMDLRGHGLSDAPTDPYTPALLVGDVLAVAEGAGLVPMPAVEGGPDPAAQVVLVGHGYGAMVAAWTAASNATKCAGLVLVDGGWQDVAAETGLTPAEWVRDLAEPPDVLRSMAAYLADRRDWDPSSWDADEEHAARVAVVEVPAGKVVPAVRPHALERSVEALFAYRPEAVLADLDVPIVAIVAADEDDRKVAAMTSVQAARQAAGRRPIELVRCLDAGHGLPRYRPATLAGAILRLVTAADPDGQARSDGPPDQHRVPSRHQP